MLPGAVIGAVEDASGLLMPGAAGVVSPAVPGEVPAGTSGCIAGAWPGTLVSGVAVVWACAATDATSAPAAKNGTSLLLMVTMHLLCERYRRSSGPEVPSSTGIVIRSYKAADPNGNRPAHLPDESLSFSAILTNSAREGACIFRITWLR